jgi:hypothetical protein
VTTNESAKSAQSRRKSTRRDREKTHHQKKSKQRAKSGIAVNPHEREEMWFGRKREKLGK